jgi:hypothetical protein
MVTYSVEIASHSSKLADLATGGLTKLAIAAGYPGWDGKRKFIVRSKFIRPCQSALYSR